MNFNAVSKMAWSSRLISISSYMLLSVSGLTTLCLTVARQKNKLKNTKSFLKDFKKNRIIIMPTGHHPKEFSLLLIKVNYLRSSSRIQLIQCEYRIQLIQCEYDQSIKVNFSSYAWAEVRLNTQIFPWPFSISLMLEWHFWAI